MMDEKSGEERQSLLRAMARHQETMHPLGAMFGVQCSCGWKAPGDSFVERIQAQRQHQADEYLAAVFGSSGQ